MPFKGVTFSGQNVTPKNDGGLYQAHYGDGILWGCSMAISGDDLVIQSGEFIAGGRVCQVDGATNVDLSTRTLTNGYIQVVMDFDMSKPEGTQWNIHLPLIESATTTFPALTRDNINDTGTLYQLQLAVIQISGGNLTSITSSLAYGGMVSKGVTYFNKSDGTHVGKIDAQNWGGGNGLMFGSCLSDGTSVGGIASYQVSGDTTIACGSGGELVLRPNGFNSTNGQVQLDATGQFIGGVTTNRYVKSASTNITSGTGWTTLVSTGNVLSSSGKYIAFAWCTYTPNTSTQHTPWFRMAGIGENRVTPTYNAGMPIYISRFVSGVTSLALEVNPQASAVTGATVSSGATIFVVRIA